LKPTPGPGWYQSFEEIQFQYQASMIFLKEIQHQYQFACSKADTQFNTGSNFKPTTVKLGNVPQ
jgi:hypothetical protein